MAKINLGAEHDRKLWGSLESALKGIGAKQSRKSWGVGGSQELIDQHWIADGQTLTVESETYIGLTLSGPDYLVEKVATLVSKAVA